MIAWTQTGGPKAVLSSGFGDANFRGPRETAEIASSLPPWWLGLGAVSDLVPTASTVSPGAS